MPMSNYFYDRFVAKGFNTLKEFELPTLQGSDPSNILQFVLNTVFVVSVEEKARVRAFNFIRRTGNAEEEYALAAVDYKAFFKERRVQDYLAALHHFEVCLAEAYQGHELLFGMIKSKFYDEKGKGREELNWRMNRLYNQSKHTEGFVKSTQFAEGDTLPVWITDCGLRTKVHEISFIELAEILGDMKKTASLIARLGSDIALDPDKADDQGAI
jgi:hypothetical protein